jgi:hypothetical protein
MKYHYVYRITNIELKKYYYGVRSSDINPKKDIGFKYFSSSSDKEFREDQKNNPQNYKYKVVSIFETREDAIFMEIELHKKFDVGINENFYNLSKQTSTGWDGSGKEAWNVGIKQTPIAKEKQSSTMRSLYVNGLEPWNKGKTGVYSEEQLYSIGNGMRGKAPWNKGLTGSQEAWNKGKPGCFSEGTINKMKAAAIGRTFSKETKEKMSKSASKQRPKAECPYCNKIGDRNLMTRYHFSNCKFKDI